MTWRHRKAQREPTATPLPEDLDKRVEDARALQREVSALRPETDRLAERMRKHRKENHLSERIVAEVLGTWRGDHA